MTRLPARNDLPARHHELHVGGLASHRRCPPLWSVQRENIGCGGQAVAHVHVAMRTAGALSYLLTDHLGSTAVTTDAAGAKTGELRYLPLGAARTTWGVIPTDRRFTGQRWDSGTALYHYGARLVRPRAEPLHPTRHHRAAAGQSAGAEQVQLCAQQSAQVHRS